MKGKMTRAVSRRQWDKPRGVGRKGAVLHIELPNEDLVQSQITGEDEQARRIRLDHVRVRTIVAADRKASRRSAGSMLRSNLSQVHFDVCRGPEFAVRTDRKYCDTSSGVIGNQYVLARGMDA